MNLGAMMKIGEAWKKFSGNHPKFAAFLQAVSNKGLPEETVMEVAVTYPDGQKMESSIRIQESDIELMQIIGEMGKQKQ